MVSVILMRKHGITQHYTSRGGDSATLSMIDVRL